MRLMILRTHNFNQYIYPALVNEAKCRRCSVEDIVRLIVYAAYNYTPAPQNMAQRQGARVAEEATTKGSKGQYLVVEVDNIFYQRHQINMHMPEINKLFYKAFGLERYC